MHTAAVWTAFVLAYSSSPFVASIRYIDKIAAQSGNVGDIGEKRVEPTCEELRAMWRYTKRQSRAATTTSGYPVYNDPFSYNMWQSYSDRSEPSHNYRRKFAERARTRAGGGAPIYGRMVHKAPAGSRLRNGMRQRTRAFEEVARLYGTVNHYPPSDRWGETSPRIGGGRSSSYHARQAGSFQHLKDLIRAERARELQEQHRVEEAVAKASRNTQSYPSVQQSRQQFLNPLPPLQIPKKVNYEFGQGRYMSNVPSIGQAWSRSGPPSREYMLR